jgi:hypothetical protein
MKKRKRTEKSRYRHETTGDHCTCAAYVAEIMCIRNSENKNEGSLPYKFWNRKPWNWTFQRQLMSANKLLKEYSETALVKAIHSTEFRGIFSLNHPKAIGVIKKYQLLLGEQKNKKQDIKVQKNAKHQNKKYGKKNIFKTLRDIEHGEEED